MLGTNIFPSLITSYTIVISTEDEIGSWLAGFPLAVALTSRSLTHSLPGVRSPSPHLRIDEAMESLARYLEQIKSASPMSLIVPRSIQTTDLQSRLTAARLWLTKITVLPCPATSFIFPKHFFWNSASPTASTSSTIRTSGSR